MSAPSRFVVELRPPRKGERFIGKDRKIVNADHDFMWERWVIVDPARDSLDVIAPVDPVPADPAAHMVLCSDIGCPLEPGCRARGGCGPSFVGAVVHNARTAREAPESLLTRETGRVRIDVPPKRPEGTQRLVQLVGGPRSGEQLVTTTHGIWIEIDVGVGAKAIYVLTDTPNTYEFQGTVAGPSESTNTAKEP
jgi:hypothetical protein